MRLCMLVAVDIGWLASAFEVFEGLLELAGDGEEAAGDVEHVLEEEGDGNGDGEEENDRHSRIIPVSGGGVIGTR